MTHFMPTSGGVILLVELFWLLQMIPPSAFLWGALLLQLGPPLQVLYVVFTSLVETKFFVDACSWDEFLDDHCCARMLNLLLCWGPLMLWGAQSSTQN